MALLRVGSWSDVRLRVAQLLANLWQGPAGGAASPRWCSPPCSTCWHASARDRAGLHVVAVPAPLTALLKVIGDAPILRSIPVGFVSRACGLAARGRFVVECRITDVVMPLVI